MNTPVDYKQEQAGMRDALRLGMLDAASRLLVEEGPSGLTVRRVAEAVNCSTTLLYSIFGGKDGLSNALYLEACGLLLQALDYHQPQLASLDGIGGIWLWARAYHSFARANPAYYQVMFGDAIAGFVPPQESRLAAWATFKPLIRQFELCMDSGQLRATHPPTAARLLWASLHGIASLELKGYYLKPELPEELTRMAVDAVLLSLRP